MTEGMGPGPAGTTPPPQYSPDGKWWWTGTEWVPASGPPPGAGFGGYSGYSGFGGPPARRATNGFAIAALVLGILWLGGLGAVCALVFGLVALKQIKRSGGTQSGHGMALAGAILGGVGILGAIALWTTVAVAGHGIVERGQTAIVKAELRQAGSAEADYFKSNGRYTDSIDDLSRYGFVQDPFGNIEVLGATATSYCLSGVGGSTDYWFFDNVHGLSRTPCS
jgi:hypothetical protein